VIREPPRAIKQGRWKGVNQVIGGNAERGNFFVCPAGIRASVDSARRHVEETVMGVLNGLLVDITFFAVPCVGLWNAFPLPNTTE
jgi:hypothetical protein